MSTISHKRLFKEAEEFQKRKDKSFSAIPEKDDLFKWRAAISGPEGSPYEGGKFYFTFYFPENYPFVPPKVKCKTRIMHCNINTNGDICLDILKSSWQAALSIRTVLLSIRQLLAEPNPDDPLMHSVAQMYKTDKARHDAIAAKWTERYAMAN